jgi:CubicO group peptidase (beta-lactamase class C family)
MSARLYLLPFLLCLPAVAWGAAPQLPGVGAAMQAAIDSHEVAGAVTVVVTKDRIVHLQASGLADIAAGKPMQPDSLFWIASMTKPVTAVAVLMLQDEGKLSVADPVAKYIPAFAALKTPSGQLANITVTQILTHTSGLGEAPAVGARNARTLSDLVPLWLAAPMQYEPGAKWQYTQSGINLAARIVEVVSGLSFDTFVQQRIFDPLGMKNTTFYPADKSVVTAYAKNRTTGMLDPTPPRADFGVRGHPPLGNGGLYSTGPDYARFCQMLLARGVLEGKRYLSPAAMKLLTMVQTGPLPCGFFQSAEFGNHGANYGWGIGTCILRTPHEGVAAMLSPGTFGHGGAWGTQAWIDPGRGVAYVLMVQRSNFPNSDASDVRRAFQQAAADALAVTPHSSAEESGRFAVVPADNPQCYGNEMFRAFEDYYSPRIRRLRARYGLDAVVAGETDEWKRILLLRHWIKSTIAIDNDHPTPVREDAFAILDAALQGGKFHCTHFSIVQHAVLNSFGYIARRLGCGPGLKDDGGHHGVNEVWVNQFSKWVLIDAKYDAHFEKNGVPLSALEIRDEVWRDGARSVLCVVGPERRPMQPDPETGRSETRPDTYRWCSWETDTNRFTAFPARPASTLIMLDDEHFRKNTWYRDGKPHWAYDTPYLIKTTRRDWIEWTPNVITSKVTIEGNTAHVFLSSCTPNFRSFQRRDDAGTWRDCGEEIELLLDKRARMRFAFRAINLFGVAGPEYRVEITCQPRNN